MSIAVWYKNVKGWEPCVQNKQLAFVVFLVAFKQRMIKPAVSQVVGAASIH